MTTFHRISRPTALLALAEIHFGHLHDDDLAGMLTKEIETRGEPLHEVLVSPRHPRGEPEASIHRLVADVMGRKDNPFWPDQG